MSSIYNVHSRSHNSGCRLLSGSSSRTETEAVVGMVLLGGPWLEMGPARSLLGLFLKRLGLRVRGSGLLGGNGVCHDGWNDIGV